MHLNSKKSLNDLANTLDSKALDFENKARDAGQCSPSEMRDLYITDLREMARRLRAGAEGLRRG